MPFTPGPIIIPRRSRRKEPQKRKEVRKPKKEKKIVYVLIKVKQDQLISEKARELEELFKGKTF
ncbi:hypothetical protein E3E27_10565, partial [Thermococcus sp. MV11]|nr:hypothetical protein [Thermococcus sp. MV11]